MANPDPKRRPDLQPERGRTSGPLIGVAVVVILAVALLVWWMMGETAQAPDPDSGTTTGQSGATVAPSATEGAGATATPEATGATVVTPTPAPSSTQAPSATPEGATASPAPSP